MNTLLTDRGGRLWVGTGRGLFRGRADGGDLQAVGLPGVPASDSRISHLIEDGQGRIWVAVDHHGLLVLDPVNGTVRQVGGTELSGQGLRAENIRALVDPGQGQIWVGTQARGLLLVDETTLATRSIHRNVGSPYGLDSDGIWSIFKDRSDVLWVGTARSLLRHNLQTSFVHTILGAMARGTRCAARMCPPSARCPMATSGWAWAAKGWTSWIPPAAWSGAFAPMRRVRAPPCPMSG